MAVTEILGSLTTLSATLDPYLNAFIIFFLILFLGFLVGKILGRLTAKLLQDVKADSLLKRGTGTSFSFGRIASAAVSSIIYAVSIILALNTLGIATVILEALLIIIVLTLLLSLLLSLKDIIPNVSAGLSIRARLRPGLRIRMDGLEGTITQITLLETVVETKRKDIVVVPNALFSRQSVVIKAHGGG